MQVAALPSYSTHAFSIPCHGDHSTDSEQAWLRTSRQWRSHGVLVRMPDYGEDLSRPCVRAYVATCSLKASLTSQSVYHNRNPNSSNDMTLFREANYTSLGPQSLPPTQPICTNHHHPDGSRLHYTHENTNRPVKLEGDDHHLQVTSAPPTFGHFFAACIDWPSQNPSGGGLNLFPQPSGHSLASRL